MEQRNKIFFDLEATSVDTETAKIIELSATVVDDQYMPIGDVKSILMNPGFAIPNTEIHGITDADVRDKPKFAAFAKALFEFFDGAILYGYNIKSYDVPLLSNEFARCGIVWPSKPITIVDPFRIFKIKEKRNLAAALKFYTGKEIDGAHRAEVDVKATIEVFAAQLLQYEDLTEKTPEELELFCDDGKRCVDLAGKIILNADGIAIYNMGKHLNKNTPITADPGYGKWMIEQPNIPNNTKQVIKKILGIA